MLVFLVMCTDREKLYYYTIVTAIQCILMSKLTVLNLSVHYEPLTLRVPAPPTAM